MADTTTIPTISFQNDLGYDIIVYDSFGDDETDSDSNTDDNYFGTLTSLGTVAAKTTTAIQPIHRTSSFIVESASAQKPVKRCTKLGTQKNITSFLVNQDDEDAMTATFNFIDFYLKNPDDPMSKTFTAILNGDADSLYSDITDFFPKYPAYAKCTLPDYMMAVTYNAMNPPPAAPSPSQPTPQPTYSLKRLALAMGARWPDGLPDITVSKFSCINKDSRIFITADIDITTLSFESPAIAANVSTLLGDDKHFTVTITFNYAFGLGIFGTRLSFLPDKFSIPAGGGNAISVTQPSITFDINPLFKFVVFTVKGIIRFDINDKKFDATISLAVDNDEASVGVTIDGDNSSFPPPPGLKGLFFDEFGVGIGVFFEPLACIIGVQGKFHIGQSGSNIVPLDDDTFALVCKITGEAITPAFASFYIPKLDLNTVITLFTNVNINLDLPVSFEDLSFRWTDSLMAAYVLPDGTLTNSGYGFSAACNIGTFGFYGDVELDLNNGLTANVEVSPVNWGNVLKLTGDGKGFSIKVDANGNPIKNNFIPSTQAEKDAVANAKSKVITTPGGPCLIINTLSMPILHLNAKASLFDLIDYAITADIDKDGIRFELDFGAILKEKMVCNLSDFHNFYGEFSYLIDKSIPLPIIEGTNLGTIPLKSDAALHLSIRTSLSDIVISTGGHFDFEGYHFSFGDFSADIHISKITDFLAAIIQFIIDEAEAIFSVFIDTAEHWAVAAGKGIITGFEDAGKVMRNVFNKSEQDMTVILKGAGFAANTIANGLKNGYNATQKDIAIAMKAAGYAAGEVTMALRNAFNATTDSVADALKTAGYAVADVANAVKNAWNAAQKDVAWAMMMVGFTETDVANGLRSAFNATTDSVADAMKTVGYKAADVAKAIRNAWNAGTQDVAWAMMIVGFAANDICSALQTALNAPAQDVANAFKAIGIGAQDTAYAIKTVFNMTIDETASILKQANYAASDVASALENAFNTSVDAVADAMQKVGYAADDVKNAFETLGGDFKNFAESAWNDVKSVFNPSNW
jgi:hypothetical protein